MRQVPDTGCAMILGIHCPMLKGALGALEHARSLRCRAMQMLPYRRHQDPAEEDFTGFREARARSGVSRLLVHSRFVPALGSCDEARRERSVSHLARELELAARWGAEAYVLHAGAYSPGASPEQGLRLVAESIRRAQRRAEKTVPVWLENVPGGGRRLGGRLEELRDLLAELPGSALVFDTAHAWAAGYELSTTEGMLKTLAKLHRLFGAQNVRAFHVNDTRAKLGSHLESHANWGEGFLGREGLSALLSREEYAEAVGIVEPPRPWLGGEASLAFARQCAPGG